MKLIINLNNNVGGKKDIFNQKKQGFTLIELLVVIAIISFIISAAIYTFTVARAKSRDALRANDIKVIITSLANYKNDKGVYPSESACIDDTSLIALIDNKNIRSAPTDPL